MTQKRRRVRTRKRSAPGALTYAVPSTHGQIGGWELGTHTPSSESVPKETVALSPAAVTAPGSRLNVVSPVPFPPSLTGFMLL